MSELRYNHISRDWVIIASERAKRPYDFKKIKTGKEPPPKWKADCPFCPGNEKDLSDETFRLGDEKTWKTRSVYNKYPALYHTEKESRQINGPYKHISGFGFHEVIVEHPDHNTCIALMKDSEVEDIITTYKSRYCSIQKIKGIQSITIFKNHGPAAGCSLEHPHSQLIATPIVPNQTRHIVENSLEFFDVTGKCIFCHTLEHELSKQKRVVLETEHFASFLPYAGAAPFVMWIIPRRHEASFDGITDAELKDLAHCLKITLAKLYHGLGNPDFNYTIRSVPVREKGSEQFHWYMTVIPRLTNPAGFELGSGMFINTSIPEESAEFLKQVKV